MAVTTGRGQRGARVLRAALVGMVALLCVACAAVYRNHGYVPADAELAQIEVGKDSHETVAEKIGRPSTQGLLNDEGWFYVQSRFLHQGPKEPVEVDRQVVVINFTDAGIVSNIGRFGLQDGYVVELSRRVTENNIKGVTFLGQLLGNIGRLQASDLLRD